MEPFDIKEQFRLHLPQQFSSYKIHPVLPLIIFISINGFELYYFNDMGNFFKLGEFKYRSSFSFFSSVNVMSYIEFHTSLPLICYYEKNYLTRDQPVLLAMHIFEYNITSYNLPFRLQTITSSGMTSLLVNRLTGSQNNKNLLSSTANRVGQTVLLTSHGRVLAPDSYQKKHLPLYKKDRIINMKKQKTELFKSILYFDSSHPCNDFNSIIFHPTKPVAAFCFDNRIIFYTLLVGNLHMLPTYTFHMNDPSVALPVNQSWTIGKFAFHPILNYMALEFNCDSYPIELYIFKFNLAGMFEKVAQTRCSYSFAFHPQYPLLFVFFGQQPIPEIFNLMTIVDTQLNPTVEVSIEECQTLMLRNNGRTWLSTPYTWNYLLFVINNEDNEPIVKVMKCILVEDNWYIIDGGDIYNEITDVQCNTKFILGSSNDDIIFYNISN